jgi:hypothetical protein
MHSCVILPFHFCGEKYGRQLEWAIFPGGQVAVLRVEQLLKKEKHVGKANKASTHKLE